MANPVGPRGPARVAGQRLTGRNIANNANAQYRPSIRRTQSFDQKGRLSDCYKRRAMTELKRAVALSGQDVQIHFSAG